METDAVHPGNPFTALINAYSRPAGTEPGLGVRGSFIISSACGGFSFRLYFLAGKGFLLLLLFFFIVCRAYLLIKVF